MIFVGDLNSDAAATTITGDPPNTSTYQRVVAAGVNETSRLTRPLDPGYTRCEAGDLLNPPPTLDQRIDYVFTRVPLTPLLDVLIGNTTVERTIFGRWDVRPRRRRRSLSIADPHKRSTRSPCSEFARSSSS